MQTFSELGLSPGVLRALTDLGIETPTPIQAQALPLLLGKLTDFIGLAATGTGKTAAFAIPLIEALDPAKRGVQALVLCPTRELATQVAGQIALMGKHKGITTLAVYGGTGYGDQLKGLKRGVSVVVGTPGRLIDHLDKGALSLASVSTVVLDEADEMISMGFKDDLELILAQIPTGQSHTWLFSATLSPEVRKVAKTYLHEPKQVQINSTQVLSETVEQLYYATQESNKPEVLCKLIEAADDFYGLIFFQTKALVVEVTQYLKGRGFAVDCLHGDMDQPARDRTMKLFRERKAKILLCTDVASRGLDVKDVTHVVNYSLPRELENYVHRIGRTARGGKAGVAMSLVTPSHRGLIRRIEQITKSRMTEGKIPTRKEIGAKKLNHALATFQKEENHARAVELMSTEWKTAVAQMTPEEVAARFLAMTNPEIFSAERAIKTDRPMAVVKSSYGVMAPIVRDRASARGPISRGPSGFVKPVITSIGPSGSNGAIERANEKPGKKLMVSPVASPAPHPIRLEPEIRKNPWLKKFDKREKRKPVPLAQRVGK